MQNLHSFIAQLLASKTVNLVSKKGEKSYSLPVEDLPQATFKKALEYGLERLFQDRKNSLAHRNKKMTDEECSEVILRKMKSGEIASTAKASSPVSKLDKRVKDMFIEKLAQAGYKVADIRKSLKEHSMAEVVQEHFKIKGLQEDKAKSEAMSFMDQLKNAAQAAIDAEQFKTKL